MSEGRGPNARGVTEKGNAFANGERRAQTAYFARHFAAQVGHLGRDFQLRSGHERLNLAPGIRADAEALFAAAPPIQWHRYSGHALSSQTCCVNFLLPLADKPEVLSRWVGGVLNIDPPEMLVIEPGRANRDWYVAFEWIGDTDYLREGDGGIRSRGANATAADAAVKFRTSDNKVHLLLIEWKYTERYGAPLSEDRRGTRRKRYSDIAFAPDGPIRSDLGLSLDDFFWEPFYQLLRQQILAWHVERDPSSGVDQARVLHLSPSENRALHDVTSPNLRQFGDDAFGVFRSLLVNPDAFIARSIEAAFSPLSSWPDAAWFAYLQDRYPSLCPKSLKEHA